MNYVLNNKNHVILGDSIDVLKTLPDQFCNLIYIDPPFNTGNVQQRKRVKVTQDANGKRKGFANKSYNETKVDSASYADSFNDYIEFLMSRIKESMRCLKQDGSIFIHLDYREVHYIKVEMDKLLGRDHFMNEIIWSYDYGGRSKSKWSVKHNTILWYANNPKNYTFNFDKMDRIPYLTPGLVGPEKAAIGKTPTDVWWHTIVPTNSLQKTGYPTQKPLGILNRFIKVHSNEGDYVMDFFGGSGTTAESAALHERKFVTIDSSQDAINVMNKRLERFLK